MDQKMFEEYKVRIEQIALNPLFEILLNQKFDSRIPKENYIEAYGSAINNLEKLSRCAIMKNTLMLLLNTLIRS
jgi:hypothetical protein